MPNHIHGIIIITDYEWARHASPLPEQEDFPKGPKTKSIGAIVGSFKSATTKRINKIREMACVSVWQRNYYEHVIRDETDLNSIREYIENNPTKWDEDKENIHT
jgi:REP element-mobilizing transposase RayT